MKRHFNFMALFLGLTFAGAAQAYTLTCDQSGSSCKVTCANGESAGTMYWNGSKWSDGLRSNADKDLLAKEMVAAQGTSCQ